ncbi:MAG: UbiA family prenyltransferase [Gammaproteobacteria bacterium]|nr:UbiA family prenyltransferase [Gammaproteobacteria bacterium]MCP4089774.1 UbiA family prenyltransferase [Gammaproteobacteria bacterium]MCP4278209.1 UbiA family prenyltransferase [Gammaproteobacteria bacterium]MCP4831928.1 UbiA family prenyltransferase [Gammaproteobacteria bacterium]MCP4927600.1 UbiA family prenyltransferase [Gammaproteobacteria bacterium]
MQSDTKLNINVPLVVDVDGTLINTDLLHESVFALLKINILYLFMLPLWLLKGKGYLKQQIADRVVLRFDLLPYQSEFLSYLCDEHEEGRRLILATASSADFATGIANHLGIFDDAFGSSPAENNAGSRKLTRIKALLNTLPFAYAGNSAVDLPIWKESCGAIVVNGSNGLRERAESVTEVVGVFDDHHNYLFSLLKAVRLHQWLKNSLIFVPLILTHQLTETQLFLQALMGFAAFSLCASSVYLLNDLLDLPADRQHPTKRFRPFAAGDLPVLYGVIAMVLLLVLSMIIALLLPPYFFPVLVLYYICTMAYSLWLKSAALVDGVMLAGLYTLRLIAGAAAIAVAPTFWLLAFSMFLFMSLALIKRYSELQLLQADGEGQLAGRAYRSVDTETLAQLGTSSGYLSVLVLAFYINSDKVNEAYVRPEALWLLCPIMLYWISRMWLLTRRGEMHDDPVVFTIRDSRTYWLAFFACVSFLLATYWPFVRTFITPFLPGL